MNCANCGQPYGPSDVFCGTCGADLNAQRAAAAAAAQQPTAAMPPQQATAVMPQQQPAQPYAQQVPAAPAQPAVQPPKKSNKALFIVLGILGGLLLLCSCAGVGTWAFMFGPLKKQPTVSETTAPPSEEASGPAGGQAGALSTSSYPTPDEAMKAELPAGWIMRKTNEGPQQVEYWAGPPNSEFTTVYLVDAQGDGGWRVTETYPLQEGGDVQPEDEAKAVVEQFLKHVMADQGMEAQKLTVEPFKNDSASAQVAAGEFLSFSITKVEPAGDDSFFVTTTQKWKGGTEAWTYRVVRTGEGMLISDLMPAP